MNFDDKSDRGNRVRGHQPAKSTRDTRVSDCELRGDTNLLAYLRIHFHSNPSLFVTDAEPKNNKPIYKGANSNPDSNNTTGNAKGGDEKGEEEVAVKKVASGRKEKSVLQAKLTKLAIQIGYAGK